MLNVFRSKPKYAPVQTVSMEETKQYPDNLWTQCLDCTVMIYKKELEKDGFVCAKCGYHFRFTALQRVDTMVDEGSFRPFPPLFSDDLLIFPGYKEKIT